MATIYGTRADLILFGLPQIILDDTPSQVTDALFEYASSRIDDAIDPGIDLPLGVVPISIKRDCCVIVTYEILRIRGFNPDGSDKLAVDAYNETVKRLEEVGKRHKAIVPDRDHPAKPLRTSENVRPSVYTAIADGTTKTGF